MSVCFARFHPNLVVGGTYSGQIVLWDNRSHRRTPVQRTPLSAAAHTVRLDVIVKKHSIEKCRSLSLRYLYNVVFFVTCKKIRKWIFKGGKWMGNRLGDSSCTCSRGVMPRVMDGQQLGVQKVSPHCMSKQGHLTIMVQCCEECKDNLLLMPTWGISLQKGIWIRQGS